MFLITLVYDTKQLLCIYVLLPLDRFIFLNNWIPSCSVHASDVVVIITYKLCNYEVL